jgi:hypothetical protein
MRVVLVLVLLGTAPALAGPHLRTVVSGKRISLVFESSGLANLVAQIDCLAGTAEECSTAVFSRLWRTELGWDERDDRALERWRAWRGRYEKAGVAAPEAPGPARPIPPPGGREVSYAKKIAIAAQEAADLGGYRANLGLLLDSVDVSTAVEIVSHFQPRFERWWRKKGAAPTAAFLDGLVQLMKRHQFVDLLERIGTFFGGVSPGSEVVFHLILRPPADEPTSSPQLENHALLEFVPGEEPKDRIDVVAHELAHYFYHVGGVDLRRGFLADRGADAIALYNLFDEAMATAIGQGMVGRRVQSPTAFSKLLATKQSFYDDDYIDAAGKALAPLVEQSIVRGIPGAEGQPIGEEFVSRYLEVVRHALGPLAARPALRLRRSAMVAGLPISDEGGVRQRLRLNSLRRWDSFDDAAAQSFFVRYPEVSGMLLVRPDHLEVLRGWEALLGSEARAGIEAAARAHSGFIWCAPRSPKASLFVLVARDEAAVMALVDRLVAQPAPFTGLGPTLDAPERR